MDKSLLFLKLDAIFSQSMGLLISSVFITPLLLMHDASLFHIGVYSVIIYLASFAQIIALQLLSNRYKPKTICFYFSLIARIILLYLGIMLITNPEIKPLTILFFFMIFYVFSNISSIAFNYWMYHLIPVNIRGRFFASRMKVAIIVANILALALTAYLNVELASGNYASYNYLPMIASLIGLTGLIFLYKVRQAKFIHPTRLSLNTIKKIFRIDVMKKHIKSIFLLYFAISMVAPFYTYYLLVKIGISILNIVILNTISQIALILFVNRWGELVDKYGIKPVLRFNAYLYILTFLIWPFTTLPSRYFLSIPLLLLIFIVIGIAGGGLNLSANLISYKLLRDKDTAYGITANNISISLGSLLGSLTGTLLTIPFKFIELSLVFTLKWGGVNHFFLVDISDIDFLFITAAIIGFIALGNLRSYRVIDEEDEEKKYGELIIGLKRYLNTYRDTVTLVFGNGVKRLERKMSGRKLVRKGISKR